MNPVQIALALKNIGGNCYLRCEPEILDFTAKAKCQLIISSQSDNITVDLNPTDLLVTMGLLNTAIFGNSSVSVIAWNLKNLFSYVKFHTRRQIDMECKLIDLKPVEGFLCNLGAMPTSLSEAITRFQVIIADKGWVRAKEIYSRIYVPLMTCVLPSLEVTGILDKVKRLAVYAYYEIEGQVNGRLRCSEVYQQSYNPHCIGPDARNNLVPWASDEYFLVFDYKNMEVSVLQWLSGDQQLAEILNSSEDFYKVVWKLISGADCDTEKKRDICKEFFLPVIYGQRAKGLAERIGVSQATAEKIIDRIYKLFATALNWIEEKKHEDIFGRRRFFDSQSPQARNFLVQAPAAIICLDKLVKLHSKLTDARLMCHIHDGYVICVKKNVVNVIAAIGKEILEVEEELYPGLKLKVTCKTGRSLAELKGI